MFNTRRMLPERLTADAGCSTPCCRPPRPTSAHSDTSATAPARPAFSILDAASSSARDAYSRDDEGPLSRPARPLSCAGGKQLACVVLGQGTNTPCGAALPRRMSTACSVAGMSVLYNNVQQYDRDGHTTVLMRPAAHLVEALQGGGGVPVDNPAAGRRWVGPQRGYA